MKILVIGNGGREHALVWKISQSKKADEVYVAPGNAGTAGTARNVNIKATDINGIVQFAMENDIGLVVVGPEAPLSEGLVDSLQMMGIPAFGPSKSAAAIEYSKVFSKDLMKRYHIPVASGVAFSSYTDAKNYLSKQSAPVVVTADGLAAGKGVVVAQTKEEAMNALSDFMEKKTLGDAGKKVLIEECLFGREMSAFVFTDGKTIVPLVPACDYKTVFDGGKGPNTGGMGSYSPPAFYTQELYNQVLETVMVPAVKAMEKEGRTYKGVLYGGLMLTQGGIKTLEFNARFGDPETQVILPRLKTDLVDIMMAIANNKLDGVKIEWSDEACVAVVMASGGYPGSYKTGHLITGLNDVDKDIMVFHAGTRFGESNRVVTGGGRVLAVVAMGKSVAEARERVYDNVQRIKFEGCQYRKDIALI